MARIAVMLIAIALVGMSAGYWLGGFAVGGGAYHVYHGYHMPEAAVADHAAGFDDGLPGPGGPVIDRVD